MRRSPDSIVRINEDDVTSLRRLQCPIEPVPSMRKSRRAITRRKVVEVQRIAEGASSWWKRTGGLQSCDAPGARLHHPSEPLIQVRIESAKLGGCHMIRIEIRDVLAVGVMELVRDAVPDDAEAKRWCSLNGSAKPSEQPQLQEVAEISRIPVLHDEIVACARCDRSHPADADAADPGRSIDRPTGQRRTAVPSQPERAGYETRSRHPRTPAPDPST